MAEIKNEYCQNLAAEVGKNITTVHSAQDPTLYDHELIRTWQERCIVKPADQFKDWITNGRGQIYFELSESDQRKAFERNKLLGLILQKDQSEGNK